MIVKLGLRNFGLGLVATVFVATIFVGGYLAGAYQTRAASAKATDDALLWQVRDLLKAKFVGEIPAPQAQIYGRRPRSGSRLQRTRSRYFVESRPRAHSSAMSCAGISAASAPP